MSKLVTRRCPDCGKDYQLEEQFASDPEEVCGPCFDAFDGMTIEELIGDDS